MSTSAPSERATAAVLLEALAAAGVSHLVGLPDNASATLFRQAAGGGPLPLLTVTREGEAFAVAAGLWIGGAEPAVVVQNTGLLEAGDSLRGTAARMAVPLLVLVTYRGYATLDVGGDGAECGVPPFATSAELDSAAFLTEPTLSAWGLPYAFYRSDADVPAVAAARRRAQRESRPVALLFPGPLA